MLQQTLFSGSLWVAEGRDTANETTQRPNLREAWSSSLNRTSSTLSDYALICPVLLTDALPPSR
jgi:hypothetical protein